jgi:asparagine synthase (glutamine-hydrolysing)
MYRDMTAYLPGDILVKLDRATMAVSLEGRVPFLDPRVIELAWRFPADWKIRGAEGKWILRRLLDRHVPARLVDRPKMGFSVPLDRWLRGAMRPWAEALLDESRLRAEGFLDPAPVLRRWRELLAGRGLWHADIWNVLMFQGWLEESTRARSLP